jgi:hypothetical protein
MARKSFHKVTEHYLVSSRKINSLQRFSIQASLHNLFSLQSALSVDAHGPLINVAGLQQIPAFCTFPVMKNFVS